MPENTPGPKRLVDIVRLQWTFPGRPAQVPSWINEVPVLVEIPLGSGA